jgi:hypothetical protein
MSIDYLRDHGVIKKCKLLTSTINFTLTMDKFLLLEDKGQISLGLNLSDESGFYFV